jgi:hypothetical protein
MHVRNGRFTVCVIAQPDGSVTKLPCLPVPCSPFSSLRLSLSTDICCLSLQSIRSLHSLSFLENYHTLSQAIALVGSASIAL